MQMIKNIQEIISIDCELYPADDLANVWEFDSLIKHFEEVKNYFDCFDFDAPYTSNTLTDYFIVDKICAWDFSNRLTPEYEIKYVEIKTYFETIKSKYEIRKIVEFLKSFSFHDKDEKYDFIFRLYDILPQYVSSLKDEGTFVKAINANPYLILDRYKEYKKVFKRHIELYNTLFTEKHIQLFIEYRFEELAEVAVDICRNESLDNGLLRENLVTKFVEYADAILANTDLNNALENQIRYKTILKFFNAVSFSLYPEYLDKQKQVDNLSNKWLEKNGHSFSYDVPLDHIKKIIDNPAIPWELKYVQLTHSHKDRKWQHFCATAMKTGKRSITELVTCANSDTNANFGVMTQQMISLYHNIHGFALQYFVRDDEKWKAFVHYTYSIIAYIYEHIDKDINSLTGEFVAWGNKGIDYFFNHSATEHERQDIAATFTDKTVKLTEKIMRSVYSSEMKKSKKFFDPEKLTLGTLLKYGDKNNPLIDILTVELMQYLAFCLIKDEDEHGKKVGISLRNFLEHDNYDWSDFEYGNGLLSLLVFVGMLNGFFTYYSKKKTSVILY